MNQLNDLLKLQTNEFTVQNSKNGRTLVIIVKQFQVIDQIQSRGLIVQSSQGNKLIWDVGALQIIDKYIGAVIGSDQNREIRPTRLVLFSQLNDFIENCPRFVFNGFFVEMNDFRRFRKIRF